MKRFLRYLLGVSFLLIMFPLTTWAALDGDGNIIFNDTNLLNALLYYGNDTNNDGKISKAEAEAFVSFGGALSNITDISGMEYFTNIHFLNLSGNSIADISPLSNLTKMYELDLSNNSIADISPLCNLPDLSNLTLANNPLNNSSTRWAVHRTDLDFVAGIPYEVWVVDNTKNNDLSSLTVSLGTLSTAFDRDTLNYSVSVENSINSIQVTPTVDFPNATVTVNGVPVISGTVSGDIPLSVGNNTIDIVVTAEDSSTKTYTIQVSKPGINNDHIVFNDANLLSALISAGVDSNNDGNISITEATTPTYLYLTNYNITDISGMEHFVNLTYLKLDRNNISNISSLSNLTSLTHLFLDINNITDISALTHLTNLNTLFLGLNNIIDISSLSNLTKLTNVDLSQNNINDITSLSNLTNLTSLGLGLNNISDISSLSNLTNLNNLNLIENNISNLNGLGNLVNLNALVLERNNITDINYLSHLTNLTSLSLGHNSISDISCLSNMTNLWGLGLESNRISDIKNLSHLTNLISLGLSRNNISDISSISNLTKLTGLGLYDNPLNNSSTRWAVHKENLDFTVAGTTYEVWVVDNTKNNDLSNLSLSSGALSPAFESDTLNYSVSVGNSVDFIQITPAVSYEKASVTVNGSLINSGDASGNIPLSVGNNTITIMVTAEDGSAKTYIVVVKRLEAGEDEPWSPDDINCKATVDSSVTDVTLIPTMGGPIIKINKEAAANSPGAKSIPVNVGNGIVNIEISPKDPSTSAVNISIKK